MTIDFITFTGKHLDLENITPDQIDIKDITHALGNICRFSGQTKWFYSVLQHSVLLEKIYNELIPNASPKNRLACLLHDATEAYLGDITRPVQDYFYAKCHFDLHKYEYPIQNIIFEKFDVSPACIDPLVWHYDTIMSIAEGYVLIGGPFWKKQYQKYGDYEELYENAEPMQYLCDKILQSFYYSYLSLEKTFEYRVNDLRKQIS